MPAGLAKLVGKKGVNWDYDTAPEPQLDNRALWWPRGKVLGGSSSINAMCYIRGVPGDYDDWAALGADGWDWNAVLPYFKRSEGNSAAAMRCTATTVRWPCPTCATPIRCRRPSSKPASRPGYALNRRLQRPAPAGLRLVPGHAEATARAVPPPWPTSTRCASATTCTVRHRRAGQPHHVRRTVAPSGVTYTARRQGLPPGRPRAKCCCSGGAINSPQLLMLSGIGPAAQLREHGIDVVHDAPQVGEQPAGPPRHLHAAALHPARDLRPRQRREDRVRLLPARSQRRRAPATSPKPAASCARATRRTIAPDIQFHFVPAMLDDHGRHRLRRRRLHRCTPASCARAAAAACAGQRQRRRQGAHRGELPQRRRKAST